MTGDLSVPVTVAAKKAFDMAHLRQSEASSAGIKFSLARLGIDEKTVNKLTQRIGYLSNNSADPASTTQYEYDAKGQLTARTTPSATTSEQYDYSCW